MKRSLSLMLLFCSLSFSQKLPMPQQELDKFVTAVMKEFEVPGVSIAIVKDGTVLLTKGYGVRKMGEKTPVDAQTLFGIASNTKAFTASAIGLLVEEGKMKWDDRVIDHLPSFQLSDPYVTREMTIRDLFVHRSGLGLGAGDLLWWPPSTYDRKEITRRLRYIPLATSFRSAYAYDNVLYTVVGEVIEAVTGKSWEEFVQTRILDVVGMSTSNTRHSDAEKKEGNIAATHAKVNGMVGVIKPFGSDNTNPAGGINSNAQDMAKWLLVQLDSGRISDTKQLFSPKTTKELWSFITPKPIGTPAPELTPLKMNFSGYGLGFNIQDYRGVKMITHTGGLPGYVSKVTMIPEMRLGICVLTNQEEGVAFMAITHQILDRFLNAPQFDWLDAYKRYKARTDARNQSAEEKTKQERNTASRPSFPAEKYAGTYRDAWYGTMTITAAEKKLSLRFDQTPSLVGTLEHWQYDTYVARWDDRELRADAFVTFQLNAKGEIEQVKMKAVSPETDFSFDFHDLRFVPVKN